MGHDMGHDHGADGAEDDEDEDAWNFGDMNRYEDRYEGRDEGRDEDRDRTGYENGDGDREGLDIRGAAPTLTRQQRRKRQQLEALAADGVTCAGFASAMVRKDWAELRDFLAAFPRMSPHDLAEEAAFSGVLDVFCGSVTLLDLKDAWRLAALHPVDALALLARTTPAYTRARACAGVLDPAHAAFVFDADLTPLSSLALPLHALRAQAEIRTLRRDALVVAANARAAVGHEATADEHALQVTPAHVALLCDLYPGARRSVEGVNAWIARTGYRFVCVPRYTRPPRVDLLLPLGHAALVQPLALEQLAVKCGHPTPQTPRGAAALLRALAAHERNATFSYCWPTDAYPADNETDSFLDAFSDMPAEAAVCWGTLGAPQRLSVAELRAWFAQPGRVGLDVFGDLSGSGATYNVAQAYALCNVLRGLEQRLGALVPEPSPEPSPVSASTPVPTPVSTSAFTDAGEEATRERARERARRQAQALADAGALRERVEALTLDALRALELDADLVRSFAQLNDDDARRVLALFRALQELAAFCLHWRGPGSPFPRLGEPVAHLADAVDVEAALYERGVPPVIAALDAVPLGLRARVLALRVFVSPTDARPGSLTLGALLESLQAPAMGEAGVGARQCVRLAARPLWQTLCAYAATFFNEALPAYERAPAR
jgi:hypothetical protein